MTRLSDRLSRLKRKSASTAEVQAKGPTQEAELPSHSRFVDTEDGRFIMRERRYPYSYEHGIYELGDLAGNHERLTRVSRRFPEMKPVASHRGLLFFDTETTGLGVGAGNVPFMMGIGFYTEDEFVVQQLFVRNPGEELAMLSYFAEFSTNFTHLVTYNGRTFDWPVVLNRYVLNRIPYDGNQLEQLDLLYISRNLWKHSLESCRLAKVEEERLGIHRVEDVSGALAPMIYFQYLADGKVEPLEGVFLHNELDVLTLSTLASHMGAILSGSVDWPRLAGEDLYRIGAWLTDSELPELAEQAFEALLSRGEVEAAPYYAPLAGIYKKLKRYDRAVPLWQKAVSRVSAQHVLRSVTLASLQPFIELAIYYEHHDKQYDVALHYTEKALDRIERRLSLGRGSEKDRQLKKELEHRRERLLSKLYRSTGDYDSAQLDLFM